MSSRAFVLASSLSFVLVLATAASGAEPGVTRTVLQKHDLAVPGHEGVLAKAEIPPGGREGRHTHSGDVFAYVIEGTATLEVEGRPAVTIKPGDSFVVEAGKVHEAINAGKTPVKLIAFFAVEKGKPMTTPAK